MNKIRKIKNYILYFIASIMYCKNSISRKHQKHIVYSIEDTIKKIIDNRCSVARFGDGEMMILTGKSISFQKYDQNLKNKLVEVIISNHDNFLICIPDVFNGMEKYNFNAREFWKLHLMEYRDEWIKMFNPEKKYYNAFISRLYNDYKNKNNCEQWFFKIKKIWYQKEIVVIEGEKSRLGVGNDLFSEVKKVERIICPPKNAFDKYYKIINEASKLNKDKLILVALGPSAKPIVYELYNKGYQAIDIGHIDIEYEWFLRNAERKIAIPNKDVNEASGGQAVEDFFDQDYYNQIISVI